MADGPADNASWLPFSVMPNSRNNCLAVKPAMECRLPKLQHFLKMTQTSRVERTRKEAKPAKTNTMVLVCTVLLPGEGEGVCRGAKELEGAFEDALTPAAGVGDGTTVLERKLGTCTVGVGEDIKEDCSDGSAAVLCDRMDSDGVGSHGDGVGGDVTSVTAAVATVVVVGEKSACAISIGLQNIVGYTCTELKVPQR